MKMAEALDGVRRLFLDTAPAIYFLERHPIYGSRMDIFFRLRKENSIILVTSPVTLAECLVHPLRRDLTIQAEQYKQLILHGVGTEFSGIGPEAAERAAGLRASHSISLIDAFQLGVAIHTGCQAFLTNDRRLSKIVDVPVLLLDDLEA